MNIVIGGDNKKMMKKMIAFRLIVAAAIIAVTLITGVGAQPQIGDWLGCP